MANPTDRNYHLVGLIRRVELLERKAAAGPVITHDVATVTAYTSGPQCEVTFDDEAATVRLLPFLTPYTPTVSDRVLVASSPAWSGVLGAVSA